MGTTNKLQTTCSNYKIVLVTVHLQVTEDRPRRLSHTLSEGDLFIQQETVATPEVKEPPSVEAHLSVEVHHIPRVTTLELVSNQVNQLIIPTQHMTRLHKVLATLVTVKDITTHKVIQSTIHQKQPTTQHLPTTITLHHRYNNPNMYKTLCQYSRSHIIYQSALYQQPTTPKVLST